MKKTKLLLSTLVSFLLAFVMVFAVACDSSTGNGGSNAGNGGDYGITDSSKDGLALDHISVRDYTETFKLGTPFSVGNLVVTATLNDYSVSDKAMSDVTLNAGEYVVDSSDYNANRVGIYTIYVSYTRSGVTRTAHYTVEVTADEPEYGGIIVKIADGKSNSVSLTAASATVTVEKDLVSVYKIGENGEPEAEPLHEDLYDADLYLGSTKIENNTTDKGGVYSLVVSLKADPSKQNFISIYVVNPVTKIEHVAGVGTYEQDSSMIDRMTDTWQFTLTYANGVTKTVKGGDAGLTIDVDTRAAGDNKTANVKYVETDASGTEHTVTCTVTYTIKATGGDVQPAGDPLVINISDLFKAGTLAAQDYTSDVLLGSDDNTSVTVLADASNAVSVDANGKSMDGYTFTHRLKLAGKGTNTARSIKIELSGAAKVTVYMMSSSGSDARNVGIWTGTFDPANDAATVATQSVGGSSLEKHEYEIDAAGTYYLAAVTGGTNVYGLVVTPAGGGSTQPSQPAGDPLVVNISDLFKAGTLAAQDYTSDVLLGSDDNTLVTVLADASNAVSVDANGKSMDGYTFTHRLKLAGKGTNTARSIKIELSGAAKVTVYMMSSSGSDARNVGIWTGTFDPANDAATVATQSVGGSSLEKHEYEIDAAGTYYLAAVTGGTNVYGIVITPV